MASKLFHLLVFLCLHEYVCCLEANHEGDFRVPDTNSSGSYHRLQDIGTLCPYNRFCQSSPLKDIARSDLEPCCERCSCDYDCHKIGSCCPDMPLAGIVNPTYPCIPLLDLAKNGDVLLADEGIYLSYHVITDCSNMLNDLAYPKCYHPTEVQDFVIVSDLESGRVYRNRHCAECNGILDYVSWKLRVQCLDMSPLFLFENFEEREKYLLANCTLLSFPPDRYAGYMSHCFQESEKITKCNVSENWDIYDKEIEDACLENREDQNAVFIKDLPWGRNTIYGSVFCYLCNVPKSLVKNDECKVRELKNGEKSGIVPFVAILDSKFEDDEAKLKISPCKSPELWDPFMELCRPLLCPPGKIPVHGRCKSTFSNFEGYTVDIHFQVMFLVGNMSVNRDILQIFENSLFQKIGSDLACGKCSSELMTRTTSPSLFLRIGVFSTEHCPSEILLGRIRRNMALVNGIYLKFKYQRQQFEIELKLTFPDGFNVNEFESRAYINHRFCITTNAIDSSIFQYCPRITLTNHEAYGLDISNVSDNSLSAQANGTDHELKQVCVDSYFLAARKARSGAASTYQRDLEYTSCNDTWFSVFVIVIVNLTVKYVFQC